MLILIAALLAETPTTDPVARMAALYDEVCLQTFPIDEQVDALMARKGATPLTPAEVKTTLRDDPGRGWVIDDGDRKIQIMLELPPYHACSVRRGIGGAKPDMASYQAVADRFKATRRGFALGATYDRDIDAISVHIVSDQRALSAGIVETLMVVDQHVTDPAKRAEGQTGVELRFVHQIRTPE